MTDDKKREFIEQYGLDPDQFLPKSSKKVRSLLVLLAIVFMFVEKVVGFGFGR